MVDNYLFNMIYTIGYAGLRLAQLLDELQIYGVGIVADVRSVPYSRSHSQFDREGFKIDLQLNGFQYVYMGDQLGARHTEETVIDSSGQVDFKKVEKLESFQTGIGRLLKGMQQYSIVLMCAEADPLNCHRFGLIGRRLGVQRVTVQHITRSGVETQQDVEQRMIREFYDKLDYFSAVPVVDQAYELLNKRIGYRVKGKTSSMGED